MATKIVLCEFGERRKRVKFRTVAGKSDVECLRDAFTESCETDPDLRSRVGISTITFQVHDPDFDMNRDVDLDEVIADKSTVKVVFNPITDIEYIFADALLPPTRKPMLEKPDSEVTVPENNLKDDDSANSVDNSQDDQDVDFGGAAGGDPDSDPHDLLDDSFESDKENQSNPSASKSAHLLKPKQKKMGNGSLYDPAPFPSLPGDLETEINNGNLLRNISGFVQLCATHILSLCDGRPTPWDYAVYLRTICTRYPELKDKDGPCYYGSFKTQLTTCIRNRRWYAKNKGKTKSTAATKRAGLTANVSSALAPDDSEAGPSKAAMEDQAANIAKLERELNKIKVTSANKDL